MSLLISLRSESVKIKRTASLYLCLITAAIIPFILFFEAPDLVAENKSGLPWNLHFLKGNEVMRILFMPMYIILISTLMLQNEHRSNTWKQVLTSPQKLVHIFFAKFIMLHILILLFIIVYNLLLVCSGLLINMLHPNLYEGGFAFEEVARVNAQMYFLTIGITALQYWLSLRFKNFIASIGIGLALWFLAPLIIFEMKLAIADKYPYSFPILSLLKKYKTETVTYQWLSVGYGVILLGLAYAGFVMKKRRV